MCEYILKVRQYRFAMEKNLSFLFFKIAHTPHKGTMKHIQKGHMAIKITSINKVLGYFNDNIHRCTTQISKDAWNVWQCREIKTTF